MDQDRAWVEPELERIGQVEGARNTYNAPGQTDGSQDYSSIPPG